MPLNLDPIHSDDGFLEVHSFLKFLFTGDFLRGLISFLSARSIIAHHSFFTLGFLRVP